MVLRAQESASQSCATIPPMRIGITVVAVVLLTAAVVLLWPSQEDRLTSEEELKRLVDGITAGQALHLRNANYSRPNPEIPADAPWASQEHTRGDVWMAQDENGDTVLYTSVYYNLDGEVVSYSRIEEDQRAFYDLATGAQMYMPLFDDDVTIADWVKGVWRAAVRNIREGYTLVDSGSWRGQETSTYETRRDPFTLGSPTIIDLHEHVADRPLLYRSARFEEDEEGNRTLESDHRILEYRLLPADTPDVPQVSVTPCVETREAIHAFSCLRQS